MTSWQRSTSPVARQTEQNNDRSSTLRDPERAPDGLATEDFLLSWFYTRQKKEKSPSYRFGDGRGGFASLGFLTVGKSTRISVP